MHITAVVTAYHPDELLRGVVEAALERCDAVIVVDNTPAPAAQEPPRPDPLGGLRDPRLTLLGSGRNVGLAAALNQGLAALPADTEAVFFLDQDSVIPDGLIDGLAKDLEDPSIGVVGPSPVDAATGRAYETLAGRHDQLDDRDMVITSGMLLRRSCLERVPEARFREDFFVDYVDLDFCLRLRRAKVRIVRDRALELPHSIGDVRPHRVLGLLTVRVGHYAAWRHYWIARNGSILVRENLRALPVWAATNTLFLGRWFVQLLLFEPRRRTHAAAFLRGLRDAATGRVTPRYIPSGAEYHGTGRLGGEDTSER
ncbi:MAG TPA: glycosyltransferase [Actinospica sp.]|nr:glycosyltransferase [Actinospica sp.]